MSRCSTAHGPFRCDKEEGHKDERGIPTECETSAGSVARVAIKPVDLDAQRELAKAARRITALEKALNEIRTTPCDAPSEGSSCLCCLHDRMVASAALNDEAAA